MRGFAGQIVRQRVCGGASGYRASARTSGAICVSSVGRVGCYPYVRDGLLNAVGATEKNAGVMFVAGLLAGAVGYLVSSPVYQVKTLAQAEAGLLENGVFATGASVGQGAALRVARARPGNVKAGRATSGAAPARWPRRGALVRGALLSAGMQVGYDGFLDLGEAARRARGRSCSPRLAACAGGVGPLREVGVVMTRYQASSEYRSGEAPPGHPENGRNPGLLPRLHAVRGAARPRVSHLAAADARRRRDSVI